MSPLRRRLFLLSLGALALMLVAGVSGVLVLRSGWFREKVRQRIIREVERATGGKTEIGRFTLDWRSLEARVDPFVLHGTEPPGEPPFLRARSIVVGLKVISLLDRDIDIALLTVEAPEIRIRVYDGGRTNIPKPEVTRGHRNPVEKFLDLAIRRFRVDEGVLQIQDRRLPLDLEGERLRARLFYEAAGPRYTGELSVRQLNLGFGAVGPVVLDLDSKLAVTGNRVEFTSARLIRNESVVRFQGSLDNLESPRVAFDFDSDVRLSDIPESVPLPVARRGSAKLKGSGFVAGASDYRVTGRLTGSGLAVERPEFRVRNAALESSFDLTPGKIIAQRVKAAALHGSFLGSAGLEDGARLRVAGNVKDISLQELGQARGLDAGAWSGLLSGPVHLEGTLAGRRLQRVRAGGDVAVTAQTGALPVEGSVHAAYDQRAGTLELGRSYLTTPSSRVEFDGTIGRSLNVGLDSGDLNDFLPVLAAFGWSPTPTLPVLTGGGRASFRGTVAGRFDEPEIAGRVSLSKFEWDGLRFDRLESELAVSSRELRVSSLNVAQNGAAARGDGMLALKGWRPDPAGSLSGSLTAKGAQLSQLLQMAGRKMPAEATLSADVRLAGTYQSPEMTASIVAAPLSIQGQRFERALAEVRYAGGTLDIPSARIESGKTALHGKGAFTHRQDDWRSGSARFEVNGSDIALALVRNLARVPEDLDGRIDVRLRGEVDIEAAQPKLKVLDGAFALSDLMLAGNTAGKITATASTASGRDLSVTIDGQVAGASVNGKSSFRLEGGYPGKGELRFTGLSLSALRPWWRPEANGRELPLEARAQGTLAFSGALADAATWNGRAELSSVEIMPSGRGANTELFALRNDGATVFTLDRGTMRIDRARFTGKDTDLEATGSVSLQSKNNALQLRFRGSVNLAILQNFERNLTASGVSTLDASIRGPVAKPEIYGRLELKDASFYLSGIPNGIDKARGVIFLFRDRATIEKVTAETGGGKLTLEGFVGFVGEMSVRLQATAERVRVRYPEGFSTYMNAALNLAGTSRRSLLSGDVTILRLGVTPRSDFASLLTSSSKPMVTPATQNELVRNMQFDVRAQTAPDARFETTLTRDVQAEADLRLRGTPYKPVVLGQVSVTQGEINFLGNRYNINRGSISFLNPARLEPLLNLDLETRVRGIDVTVTFSGPPNKLTVSYRSDPPLQPSEIIALLAVGRAPAGSPTLAARQSEQDQSWQQFGAATLVGQALAAPVAGRLQRFFGVSRIKIDPKLTGIENNPEARLTLEQQVSKDITFTYITNLTQTQEQIVRVEWNVNRQWSVLAVRDANGLFGIDFLYRKQFK